LGSLGGLQLTLTIPDMLVLITTTALGDEFGAAAMHRTAGVDIMGILYKTAIIQSLHHELERYLLAYGC